MTSRIDVPETIKDANARYGKYMDEHGADEVFNFAPFTKIAREGRKGRKEFEKEILKAESPQASEAGLGLSQTRNALSPELRAGVIMPQNNIVVNSILSFITSLIKGDRVSMQRT